MLLPRADNTTADNTTADGCPPASLDGSVMWKTIGSTIAAMILVQIVLGGSFWAYQRLRTRRWGERLGHQSEGSEMSGRSEFPFVSG